MKTECNPEQLEFHALGRREVIGRFDGGRITSDGGGLLLREVDQRLGLLDRLAGCFSDYRNPNAIEHSVAALVAQRVYGLALGYEDLNDHDVLRKDSVLALLVAVWLGLKLLGLVVAVLKFVNGDETAVSRFFDRNRERKGYEALSEGMMALASGEGHLAMTKAVVRAISYEEARATVDEAAKLDTGAAIRALGRGSSPTTATGCSTSTACRWTIRGASSAS